MWYPTSTITYLHSRLAHQTVGIETYNSSNMPNSKPLNHPLNHHFYWLYRPSPNGSFTALGWSPWLLLMFSDQIIRTSAVWMSFSLAALIVISTWRTKPGGHGEPLATWQEWVLLENGTLKKGFMLRVQQAAHSRCDFHQWDEYL